MAIQKYAGDRITGLSTDTKPTNVKDGAIFVETDTQKIFILDGTWKEIDYSGGVSELDDLDDVDTSGVSDDDILTYNSTSGDFEANKISIQNFKNSKIYISEDNDAYLTWNNGNIELYKNGELVQKW